MISVHYSIFNSEFDPLLHKLHAIKVSNEIADPFSSSETKLFFLVANELHWLNDVNAMVKLGRLVGFRDEKNILNFVQIKVRSATGFSSQVVDLIFVHRRRHQDGRIK